MSDEEADLAYKGEATPAEKAAMTQGHLPVWDQPAIVPPPTGPPIHNPTQASVPLTQNPLQPTPEGSVVGVARTDDRLPRRPGTGLFILVGAFVGLAVLAITWALFLRGSSSTAIIATPIRSSVIAPSPSVSATPSITSTRTQPPVTPSATPTVSTPGPSPSLSTTVSTSVSATATGALNDPQNSKGWTFIIDGVGPVKLGMRASDAVTLGVLTAGPTACSPYSPTEQLGATKVYARGEMVDTIDVRSPQFASGRGLRVGSTLAQLKAAYGKDLKQIDMLIDGSVSSQYALLNPRQYIAYVVADDVVSRIAIGYRGAGGSIALPPPC